MAKTPAQLDREISEATGRCNTCGRSVSAPYRRIVGGKVVEGCIDNAHTGHLYGGSLEWHNRPVAKKFRAEMKARRQELLRKGRS